MRHQLLDIIISIIIIQDPTSWRC